MAFSRLRIYFAISMTAVLAVLLLSVQNSQAASIDEKIHKIQRAYRGIHDLRGSFIQKNTITDLGRTDVYKGDFLIKYPLMMKWNYTGKMSQIITINKDTVLIFNKEENQAFKGKFDRTTYGQTPVALLSGFRNIKDEFDVSEKDGDLHLVPKQQMGNVSSITLAISGGDFPIQSFTIKDGRSNVIQIELRDVKINTGIDDSHFDMSLPEGVNLLDQRP